MTGLTGTGQLSLESLIPTPSSAEHGARFTEGTPMARAKHLPGSGHEGGVEKPCPSLSLCICWAGHAQELQNTSINANISLTKISGTCSFRVQISVVS